MREDSTVRRGGGLSLSGHVVVVTGAGRGLGRAYASALCAAGARVVLFDWLASELTQAADQLRSEGYDVIGVLGSVASEADVERLFSDAINTFGHVDGLINNAAVLREADPWAETFEDSVTMVKVNLLGSIICGISAMRHMRAVGKGSIVNISSGALVGMTGIASYGATKAAALSLTYSWAQDLEPYGVRVNAVLPVASTSMTRDRSRSHRSPNNISPLLVYLQSARSSHITGRAFRHDGRTISLLPRPELGIKHVVDDLRSPEAVARTIEQALATAD